MSLNSLDIYVHITGTPSHEDDSAVPGWYLLDAQLAPAVDLRARGALNSLREVVLDELHDHVGIEVLDDFTIQVYDPRGTVVSEAGEDEIEDFDAIAYYECVIDTTDVPSEVLAAAGIQKSPRQRPL